MNDPIFRASEFPFIETDDPIECSPFDCMCGIYDNPYDNYFYSHKQNPAQQHISWLHQWKKQHSEIHQSCKDLGQASHTDDYVKGFMDGISMEPPNRTPLNITRMEDEADRVVSELMSSNHGT